MERTISHHWIRQLSCVCVFLQGYITSARIIKHELLTKYCCHHDIPHKIVSDRTINLITVLQCVLMELINLSMYCFTQKHLFLQAVGVP